MTLPCTLIAVALFFIGRLLGIRAGRRRALSEISIVRWLIRPGVIRVIHDEISGGVVVTCDSPQMSVAVVLTVEELHCMVVAAGNAVEMAGKGAS